jgi:hypothetical protein
MERALRGEFDDLWFDLEEARKAAARPLHSSTAGYTRLPRLLPRKNNADYG